MGTTGGARSEEVTVTAGHVHSHDNGETSTRRRGIGPRGSMQSLRAMTVSAMVAATRILLWFNVQYTTALILRTAPAWSTVQALSKGRFCLDDAPLYFFCRSGAPDLDVELVCCSMTSSTSTVMHPSLPKRSSQERVNLPPRARLSVSFVV